MKLPLRQESLEFSKCRFSYLFILASRIWSSVWSSSGDARIEDVSLCHCSASHLLAPLLNEVLIIVGFSFRHGVQFSSWGSIFKPLANGKEP